MKIPIILQNKDLRQKVKFLLPKRKFKNKIKKQNNKKKNKK